MIVKAAEMRQFAQQQREAAEQATLPSVRDRHLRAAASWDKLARQSEFASRKEPLNPQR